MSDKRPHMPYSTDKSVHTQPYRQDTNSETHHLITRPSKETSYTSTSFAVPHTNQDKLLPHIHPAIQDTPLHTRTLMGQTTSPPLTVPARFRAIDTHHQQSFVRFDWPKNHLTACKNCREQLFKSRGTSRNKTCYYMQKWQRVVIALDQVTMAPKNVQ